MYFLRLSSDSAALLFCLRSPTAFCHQTALPWGCRIKKFYTRYRMSGNQAYLYLVSMTLNATTLLGTETHRLPFSQIIGGKETTALISQNRHRQEIIIQRQKTLPRQGISFPLKGSWRRIFTPLTMISLLQSAYEQERGYFVTIGLPSLSRSGVKPPAFPSL